MANPYWVLTVFIFVLIGVIACNLYTIRFKIPFKFRLRSTNNGQVRETRTSSIERQGDDIDEDHHTNTLRHHDTNDVYASHDATYNNHPEKVDRPDDAGTAQKSTSPAIEPPATETGTEIKISYLIPPLVGVLLLLITLQMSPRDMWMDGVIGDDHIKPYTIILLVLAVSLVCVSLDFTGALSFLAFHFIQSIGTTPFRLFTLIYCMTSTLSAVTSNDVMVLTITPVVIYCSSFTGASPYPYLFAAFAASNLASIFFVVGNPTNVIIADAFNITFLDFSFFMLLPAVVCLGMGYIGLYCIFRTDLRSAHAFQLPQIDPQKQLRDPLGAIVHTILLLLSLIVMTCSSFISTQIRIWMVACISAGISLLYNIVKYPLLASQTPAMVVSPCLGESEFNHVSSSLRLHEDTDHAASIEICSISQTDPKHSSHHSHFKADSLAMDRIGLAVDAGMAHHAVPRAITPLSAVPVSSTRSGGSSTSAPGHLCRHGSDLSDDTNDSPSHQMLQTNSPMLFQSSSSDYEYPHQRYDQHATTFSHTPSQASVDTVGPMPIAPKEQLAAHVTSYPLAPVIAVTHQPDIVNPNQALGSMLKPELCVVNILRALPWGLIPFVVCMFILVQSLVITQWVDYLGDLSIILVGGTSDVTNPDKQSTIAYISALSFGMLTILLCNLMNNQPATILLARVLQLPQIQQLPPRVLHVALYSVIAAANYSACLTIIAALAGILFIRICRQAGIHITYLTFLRVGIVLVPLIFLPIGVAIYLASLYVPT